MAAMAGGGGGGSKSALSRFEGKAPCGKLHCEWVFSQAKAQARELDGSRARQRAALEQLSAATALAETKSREAEHALSQAAALAVQLDEARAALAAEREQRGRAAQRLDDAGRDGDALRQRAVALEGEVRRLRAEGSEAAGKASPRSSDRERKIIGLLGTLAQARDEAAASEARCRQLSSAVEKLGRIADSMCAYIISDAGEIEGEHMRRRDRHETGDMLVNRLHAIETGVRSMVLKRDRALDQLEEKDKETASAQHDRVAAEEKLDRAMASVEPLKEANAMLNAKAEELHGELLLAQESLRNAAPAEVLEAKDAQVASLKDAVVGRDKELFALREHAANLEEQQSRTMSTLKESEIRADLSDAKATSARQALDALMMERERERSMEEKATKARHDVASREHERLKALLAARQETIARLMENLAERPGTADSIALPVKLQFDPSGRSDAAGPQNMRKQLDKLKQENRTLLHQAKALEKDRDSARKRIRELQVEAERTAKAADDARDQLVVKEQEHAELLRTSTTRDKTRLSEINKAKQRVAAMEQLAMKASNDLAIAVAERNRYHTQLEDIEESVSKSIELLQLEHDPAVQDIRDSETHQFDTVPGLVRIVQDGVVVLNERVRSLSDLASKRQQDAANAGERLAASKRRAQSAERRAGEMRTKEAALLSKISNGDVSSETENAQMQSATTAHFERKVEKYSMRLKDKELSLRRAQIVTESLQDKVAELEAALKERELEVELANAKRTSLQGAFNAVMVARESDKDNEAVANSKRLHAAEAERARMEGILTARSNTSHTASPMAWASGSTTPTMHGSHAVNSSAPYSSTRSGSTVGFQPGAHERPALESPAAVGAPVGDQAGPSSRDRDARRATSQRVRAEAKSLSAEVLRQLEDGGVVAGARTPHGEAFHHDATRKSRSARHPQSSRPARVISKRSESADSSNSKTVDRTASLPVLSPLRQQKAHSKTARRRPRRKAR